MALHGIRGIFSHVREYPPWTPKRTQGALPLDPAIASEQLEELQCLPIALPIARRCRVSTARRFASAPTTRCCAAVGGSAALRMRHTPCGCRSADLVGVRTNFRLPPVSTMRRAQQCRYFARSLPPCYRHSRLTIVRRGCNRCRIARIHGEAMYTAPDSAGRAALRATIPQCRGSRGTPLAFLWGIQRGYSLRKENTPFGAAVRTPLPLPRSRGKIRSPLWKRV